MYLKSMFSANRGKKSHFFQKGNLVNFYSFKIVVFLHRLVNVMKYLTYRPVVQN